MFNIPTQYYTGINIPSELDLNKFLCIITIQNYDVDDQLELVWRIGSENFNVKVYAGKINNTRVAVKVLKYAHKLDHEITINKLLQHDVNNNLYFLYYIKGQVCHSGINDNDHDNDNDNGILIMEMAMCDIKQKIKYCVIIQQDIYRMITEVLESLLVLARLGIYHGDLHAGNVFIVMRDGKFRTVIGDFGESMLSTSPTSSSSDLFQFIRSLREEISYCHNNHHGITSTLDVLYQTIGKIAGKCENNFDIYLELGSSDSNTTIKCNVEFIQTIMNEWEKLMLNIINNE